MTFPASVATLRICGVPTLAAASRSTAHGADSAAWPASSVRVIKPPIRVSVGETDTALAVVHEPDYFPTMVELTPVQLQLSGHSHGGQVRIPALGPLRLPPWGRIYHTGLYELNGHFVYTGRGLGMVELPVRFNCPPELTEITLETA